MNDPEKRARLRPLEVVQQPGETIFVPNGWWHTVLNIDFTVAVTQNFTTTANFVESWKSCQTGRPKLSRRWYERLSEVRPDLAKLADQNRLPYDPVEKRRE